MNNATVYSSSEVSLSRTARFWLLLIFEIPSVSCSFFISYHSIRDGKLWRALQNHVIIFLNLIGLLFKLIDVPLYLHFIRNDQVSPPTPAHCLVWWFVDLGFYYICGFLVAWASIERHILIFHHSWFATNKQRVFVHYLPLVGIMVYGFSYYTWVILFPPCENHYNYHLPVCAAAPCYLSDPVLVVWELGVHGCVVTLLITIFNISLIIRVVVKKSLRNQAIRWRHYRKMTYQMLFISMVFILFNLPITVMYLARTFGLPSDVGVDLQLYFFFITYWLLFSLPFVCLNSLPNLHRTLRNFFRIPHRCCARSIVPRRTYE